MKLFRVLKRIYKQYNKDLKTNYNYDFVQIITLDIVN
jgi:hypothetical protein